MSESPSSSFNPIALVTVLVVAAIAGGLFLLRSENAPSSETEETAPKTSTRSDRSSTPKRRDAGGPTNSGGLSENEKNNLGGRPADLHEKEIKRALNKATTAAREELATLREKEMTPFGDPQKRREFENSLAGMSDRERTVARRDWIQKTRAAKNLVRSQLPQDHFDRKERLNKVMQFQNLWQRSSFIGRTPNFTPKARKFERRLVAFAEEAEFMDDEKFHQRFDALQKEVALMAKTSQGNNTLTTSGPDQQSNTLTP